MFNKRKIDAYKLRIYFDQIKAVEAMTQEQWLTEQCQSTARYMTRDMWLAYLKECALVEANKLANLDKQAA